MMRSLYAGVSGLKNHQVQLDVIGNNIANVNTPGYKRSRVLFEDLYSQLLKSDVAASSEQGGVNPVQVGAGVTIGSVDVIYNQGSLQPTDKVTDLAINGEGYFLMQDPNSDNYLYSRVGAFDFDETGTLVNGNGLRAMGWIVNPTTGAIDTRVLQEIVIPKDLYLEPIATSQLLVGNNLNVNAVTGTAYSTSKTIYDSEGQQHNVELSFTKIADNQWSYQVRLAEDDPAILQYLTDNYPNFADLTATQQAIALEVAQVAVLEPDAVAATTGNARNTLTVPPAQAGISILQDKIQLTALDGGTAGNNISIEAVAATGANVSTTANVIGNRVVVTLGTSSTGQVNATLDQVVKAINLGPASSLVSASLTVQEKTAAVSSDTAGVTAATVDDDSAAAEISGAVTVTTAQQAGDTATVTGQGMTFTAVAGGTAGNEIQIELVNPGAAQPLSVAVVGNTITITLAHDGGVVTSTTADIVAAITADVDAAALVTASDGDATVAVAGALTTADGTDTLSVTATRGATTETVTGLELDATTVAFTSAWEGLNLTLNGTGAEGTATVTLQAPASLAQPVPKTSLVGGFDSVPVQIVAQDGGLTGNDISIRWEAGDSTAVTVDGTGITVTYAPGATVQQVVDAINNHAEASVLVEASVNKEDGATVAGPIAQTWLAGGFLQGLDIRAGYGGEDGNDIGLELLEGTGINQSTQVVVEGNEIKVYLGTGSDGLVNATLADVVAALNTHPDAALLVDAYVKEDPDNDLTADTLATTTPRTVLTGGVNSTGQPSSGKLLFDANGRLDQLATREANGAEAGQVARTFSFDPVYPKANTIVITPDFSGLTQFAAASTAVVQDQNGNASGTINSINIDGEGTISGSFSGGMRKELGQIALAGFANPAGLERMGENLFRRTSNSGEPQIGAADSLGRGRVVSGSLEMSNVDLAQELTDMIVAQRGFQANSRVISTSDDMLQELINLKR